MGIIKQRGLKRRNGIRSKGKTKEFKGINNIVMARYKRRDRKTSNHERMRGSNAKELSGGLQFCAKRPLHGHVVRNVHIMALKAKS